MAIIQPNELKEPFLESRISFIAGLIWKENTVKIKKWAIINPNKERKIHLLLSVENEFKFQKELSEFLAKTVFRSFWSRNKNDKF